MKFLIQIFLKYARIFTDFKGRLFSTLFKTFLKYINCSDFIENDF